VSPTIHTRIHTHTRRVILPNPDCPSPCESPANSRKSKAIFLPSWRKVRISREFRYQKDQWAEKWGDVGDTTRNPRRRRAQWNGLTNNDNTSFVTGREPFDESFGKPLSRNDGGPTESEKARKSPNATSCPLINPLRGIVLGSDRARLRQRAQENQTNEPLPLHLPARRHDAAPRGPRVAARVNLRYEDERAMKRNGSKRHDSSRGIQSAASDRQEFAAVRRSRDRGRGGRNRPTTVFNCIPKRDRAHISSD